MRNGAIGLSVLLLAVGAILVYAIEADATDGIDLDTAGLVMMIVGAIGIVASLAVLGNRDRVVTHERVVDRNDRV